MCSYPSPFPLSLSAISELLQRLASRISSVAMRSLFVSASFVALALLRRVNAISETLVVANSEIAPDGFKRSLVSSFRLLSYDDITSFIDDEYDRATLVNGQFPGPLIAINKGDRFSVRVALIASPLNACR